MNQLQMLKRALIAYVNSMKTVWSALAHPLSIVSKRKGMLKDYRICGNSVQDGESTPDNPIEVQSVGELTTKNLFDKDNLVVYRTGNVSDFEVTNTGIKYMPTLHWGYYTVTIGLASDYAGKTLCFSWKGNNYNISQSTRIIIYDSDNTQVAESGNYVVLDDGTKYTMLTIDGEYTTETLVLRFYYGFKDNIAEGFPIEFDDVMLCESSEYVPYEPYHKYKVPVTVRGKNLYDKETYPMTGRGWVSGVTGNISNTNDYSCTDYIPCNLLRGKTITLSPTGGQNSGVAFYDANYGYISGKAYNQKAYCTVTVPEDAIYMRFSSPVSNKEIFMVEYGNTATPYEPYIEPQTHNIYLDEPLRKIGEYEDYVDFKKNMVVRNVYKRVLDGSEFFYRNSMVAGAFAYPVSVLLLDSNKVWCLCNRLEAKTWDYLYGNKNLTDGNYRVGVAKKSDYLVVCPYSILPTSEEWKAQLVTWHEEGNPMTVWYVRPSKEEAIELPKLPQFKGTTIYEVDTEVKPSGIEVCYYE